MRKQLLAAILLVIVTAFAADARKHRKPKRPPVNKPVATAPPKGISSVLMRRGACFGRCAEFVITMRKDGLVEYNGIRNVEMTGVYQHSISADKVASLFKEFTDYRVDTCSTYYQALIPDLPGLYFEFIIDGVKKPIGNAHFGPGYLRGMAQELESVAGKPDASWKKISDKPSE